MEKTPSYTFADSILASRKKKPTFFDQLEQIIDWQRINNILHANYKPGKRPDGRPNYPPMLLFRMCLISTFYGLSDYETEAQCMDALSFKQFCGLGLSDDVPDHSTLSRFRSHMTKRKVYDLLLTEINQQLEKQSIIVKPGAIVDATLTPTPRKPKGNKKLEIKETDDKQEVIAESVVSPGVDKEAAYNAKGGKITYGYKMHTVTDPNGLVMNLITTPANVHDTTMFKALVADLPEGTIVAADKGYASAENDRILRNLNIHNAIMTKKPKGKAFTNEQRLRNKAISKVRYCVERTFGGIKLWFRGGLARYVGLEKMHTQHVMQSICYNLYRTPNILLLKKEKQQLLLG